MNERSAVLMAAGMGTRMRPLTEKTAKPLVEVKGRRMIETVIDGLHAADVHRIFVVTGYKHEQFDFLEDKYEGLKVLVNTEYETVNNISSVHRISSASKEELSGYSMGDDDLFICEADLYIPDPSVFKSTPDFSVYFGKMVKGFSDDWVFETGDDGYISRVGKKGTDLYNMCGISFFKAADASILKDVINKTCEEPGYEDLFWDDAVNMNLKKLRLKVHPIKEGDITEIDSIEELAEVDPAYKSML